MANNSRRIAQRPTAAGPVPVQVLIGGRWLSAKAHAIRDGRLGSQVLIDCHGYLVWVTATRVRRTLARQPHDLPEPAHAEPDLAAGTDGSEHPPKR